MMKMKMTMMMIIIKRKKEREHTQFLYRMKYRTAGMRCMSVCLDAKATKSCLCAESINEI